MRITPFANSPIGADVEEIDITSITATDFDQIYAAWLDHAILRFRDQHITDDELKDFSQNFGPLEYAPHGKVTPDELAKIPNPFVATISNIVENGRPIGGLSNVATSWHTDMSYIESPPTASLLYAVEVPATGGETSFCSMSAVYKTLPLKLRERCFQLVIKHDSAHDSLGKLRRGHATYATPKDAPGAFHRAVCKHPETGANVLFLGRRQNAYIKDHELGESEQLLDDIWDHVARPEHCWTQHWLQGDLVVWDNRSVMHRRNAFPDPERRLMRRTQVRSTEKTRIG